MASALAADRTASPEEGAVRIGGSEAVVRTYPTQWFNFYRFWENEE